MTIYPDQLQTILDFIDDFENGEIDDVDTLVLFRFRTELNELYEEYKEFADREGSDGYEILQAISCAANSLDEIENTAGIIPMTSGPETPPVDDSGPTVYDIARATDRSDD